MSGANEQTQRGFEWLAEKMRLLKIRNIEHLATLGGFNSSLISHVKTGRKNVGKVFIGYIVQGLKAAGYGDITQDIVAQEFGYWGDKNTENEEMYEDIIAKNIAARLREIKDPTEQQETIKDIETDIQRAIDRTRRASKPDKKVGSSGKTSRGSE